MRDRKTSRILNDESFFLGLSYSDISGSGALLLVIFFFLKALGVENMFWAFLSTLFALSLLIPVRLGFRRKIIRDSLFYLVHNGVIYVSKNNRDS